MAALLADETAAYEAAKPVLVATCARCHQQGGKKASRGKLKHFDMTSYPFTGHHTREVGPKLREVLGAAGKPASMPPDGDLTPEQVALDVLAGLGQETFVILPHPQVLGYMRKKTENYDRWIAGMAKIQAKMREAYGKS